MQSRDVLALATCVLLFAILIAPLRDAVVDDTYIHLQYARNLAEAGELSFNRGYPAYGATSPLWVALLALFYRAGADMLVWCRVLSWFFGVLSIVLVFRITVALDGRTVAPFAAALVCAAEAWFLRWAAVGMETSFAVFMVLLAISASLTAARSAARSALFGLVLLLAVLTRPEILLMVPLAVVAFALARKGTPLRRFAFLPVFLGLFAIWLYLIHRHTGNYFPLTAGAKQGRPVLSPVVFGRALIPARIMGATILLPWLSLLAGLGIGAWRHKSLGSLFGETTSIREAPGTILILMWSFTLPLAYVLLDFQVLSRYLVPVMPGVIVLGVVAWRRIASRLWRGPGGQKYAVAVFAAVAILQSVSVYLAVVVPPTQRFSRALETTIAGMGKWLEKNSDADAVVATPDIGAIGYFSRRRILDLGGLISPEINRMRNTIDVERIIEEGLYLEFGPDYLVDRSETAERFSGKIIKDVRCVPVMRGDVPNLGIRKPKPVVYVLYRLEKVRPRREGN